MPFRRNRIIALLLAGLFMAPFRPQAQNTPRPILFKNGYFTGARNIHQQRLVRDSLSTVHYKKNYYVLLQFDKLPGLSERKELSAAGIRLFDYIPGNAFLAEIPEGFSQTGLESYRVSGLHPLPARFKIARQLLDNPDAVGHDRDFLVAVGYFGTMDAAEVGKELEKAGASLVSTKIRPNHILFIQATRDALLKIAALPFVSYLGMQSVKSFPLNYNDRATQGVNAIASPSGRNLQGRGVTVGVGDNSDPYTHVDFTGRLIERFSGPVANHGTHVSGTVGGGGILDPRNKGMAPKATIVSQLYTDILVNAPIYSSDYHMVLTSNSYTAYPSGCLYNGEYDALSNYVDDQLSSYPHLLHDFASGNDGDDPACSPYAQAFATVKSGFQCAKNVLTVGNSVNINGPYGLYYIDPSSSRGPVNDGRIKPEIVAGGYGIVSTFPNNAYGTYYGTSQSCPAVTGSLALLYERYRQLHGGSDPSAALIKAIACNTATDRGNPGPDYTFGFGMLNASAAVETMEHNEYFTGSLSDAGTATFTIPGIPAGTAQVKVLLYWPDAAAAPFASTTLVNDLDLAVKASDGTNHLPLILDPSPAHCADNAVEGADHLNNIEQVVINNPPAGDVTIKIAGTQVPSGPQNYVIAYQVLAPAVILQYPFGNDTWVPGEPEIIRWEANGDDTNPFTLEYSADNGSSWTTIDNSVPGTHRMYQWVVPATATSQGLIRVSRNGTSYSDVSHYNFTVLGAPVITLTNPCQGYAQLDWALIPSATSYDILQLKGDSMQVIANTTATTYLLGNLRRDSLYWLAVRAVNGLTPGRRSLAAKVLPSGGACLLTALDNDLTVDSLIAPVTGRSFTSSALGNNMVIQVELKNLGSVPTAAAYTLSYRVNGGPVVTEPVATTIPSNGTSLYNFTQPYDFSAAGVYTLQLWVTNPGDPRTGNDTITRVVKQLQNDPLILSPAFTEGFESALPEAYILPTLGLDGSDRSDFRASNANGRVRTFVNTGFARTGLRCATLDQNHYSATTSTTDSLITTFNLSGYTATDQLWLDFYYLNHGVDFSRPGNQVWIRGNDQAAWIPVYALDSIASNFGIYQTSPAIDITGTLTHAVPAQAIGSSFQVKFGEQGYTSATSSIPDGNLDDGYSFDDITVTRSVNDMAVTTLVNPVVTNLCNLSNAETISVKVKNYTAMAAHNIPVTYSINGISVTESIPLINPFDSITYVFTHKADLAAYQLYILTAWVSYPGDTYHRNDTLLPVRIQTTPLITSYPYLEGFESSNGYWYTDGLNDSWEWGVPAKTVINKAANGTKAWVTSLKGTYNNNEQSYLYSPCFDLSGLTQPVLSFSHIFQTEDNCNCDFHWAEYCVDGVNWIKLGAAGSGIHWYDNATTKAWQLSDPKWHVSSYDIPVHPSKIRFRIVMSSDPGTTYEGIGIDDIHIFDKTPIYTGVSIGSGLTQAVSGNNWIHFDTGGRRVASINPNGQDLGSTTVKVFIRSGALRDTNSLYYLNRNIVLQPTNPPLANVSVRYYFTDAEADSLIHATGCPGCSNLHDAYQAGVTQYSSPVLTEEDSTLVNDSSGTFHFLQPHKDLSILPYDNGYYAEYQVGGFSEFWINSGLSTQSPLPLALLSFTATRAGHTGVLQWNTMEEATTSRYLIEKSSDGADFKKLDSTAAHGNSGVLIHYQYTDPGLWNGVNYYRLKMIGLDGSFKYSPIRSITDTISKDTIPIPVVVPGIHPNPIDAGGILTINTPGNCHSIILMDVSGRILKSVAVSGMQNTLSFFGIAKGIYFLRIETDAGRHVQKILVK